MSIKQITQKSDLRVQKGRYLKKNTSHQIAKFSRFILWCVSEYNCCDRPAG